MDDDMSVERALTKAVELRKENKLEEARNLLLDLVKQDPANAQVNLQTAWTHDMLGLEREAVQFYERAIESGLNPQDLEEALLGLGSTYRCIGNYPKAVATLRKGVELYPANRAMQCFLALALYNSNSPREAVELLLTNLLETTKDSSILGYTKALTFYADKLDQIW
jgi:tetratricopeptide (TPR) repeat protein